MVQPVSAVNQLMLDFEPAVSERFATLREYMAFCVNTNAKPAKSIAMDMDMSPSTLSRKLTPGDGDTSRLNVDDLECYMRVTGDLKPLGYLAAKFGQSDELRQRQALLEMESILAQLRGNLSAAMGGGAK